MSSDAEQGDHDRSRPAAPEPSRPPVAGPTPEQLVAAVHARRRSAPRYRVFVGLGVLAGVVAAVVLTSFSSGDGGYGAGSVLGYTALLLALVGGLLGGAVAVLLDRR